MRLSATALGSFKVVKMSSNEQKDKEGKEGERGREREHTSNTGRE